MRAATMTIITVAASFCLLFCLEKLVPLRRRARAVFRRLVVNLAISGLAFLTAGALVRPAMLKALNWDTRSGFGILQIAKVPPWAGLIVTFLLMDLSFYWWHIANHRI